MLFGAAKVFSNVQWLSGVRPVLSKKSKFKAVVEEVSFLLEIQRVGFSGGPQLFIFSYVSGNVGNTVCFCLWASCAQL